MTPACKLLKAKRISYTIHEYIHDANATNSYGLEAVEKLDLQPEEVFKTLLITDGKQFYVSVLPVSHQLNLKKVAQALECKKVVMADLHDAERITGYLVGGISPIGQKKRLKTLLAMQATSLEKIYISGGRRGLDIGIKPDDLVSILNASFADII